MTRTAKSLINTEELGRAIRRRREELGLSLRDVADQTNVSASTLSRIENGTGKPDADNIARLTTWLDVPLERILTRGRDASDPKAVVYYPHESTPEIVEAQLNFHKRAVVVNEGRQGLEDWIAGDEFLKGFEGGFRNWEIAGLQFMAIVDAACYLIRLKTGDTAIHKLASKCEQRAEQTSLRHSERPRFHTFVRSYTAPAIDRPASICFLFRSNWPDIFLFFVEAF